MSDDTNQNSETREPTELELLKDRARQMGIVFSNNIGVNALKAKIDAKMEGKTDNTNADGEVASDQVSQNTQAENNPSENGAESAAGNPDAVAQLRAGLSALSKDSPALAPVNALTGKAPAARTPTLTEFMRQEQMKLIRIRISCLDPKKKDLQGEIFTVANEFLGTVKKFVPFGEVTDNGFHVPYCIYELLKSRKFLNISVTKDRRNGQTKVNQQWAKEFSIDVLDPLTPEEIERLATAQAAAGSVD